MANAQYLAILRGGIGKWNAWRRANPTVRPDLRGMDLDEADLREANLSWADLSWTNLSKADLSKADLRGANLYDTNLGGADLSRADLREADLSRAYLRGAYLVGAYLDRAHLVGADLWDARLTSAQLRGADLSFAALDRAHLYGANLYEANLTEADLTEADLSRADFSGADLSRADLSCAILRETSFINASLNGCRVYGVSAWDVHLEDAIQTNLRITPDQEPDITVDNLEIAQFLYLMLHNEKIRQVIETPASKIALILGRLTAERKAELDPLRDRLLQRGYTPVFCNLEGASERNGSKMVTLLARMARFIIADITEPADIPAEFQAIVPHVQTPVLPVIEEGLPSDAVFAEHREHPWVLEPYRYTHLKGMVSAIEDAIIAPVEARIQHLHASRKPANERDSSDEKEEVESVAPSQPDGEVKEPGGEIMAPDGATAESA